MCNFKLILVVIFTVKFTTINAQISDKRLCVDEDCKVPISKAKTLMRYSSPDFRILSFAPNEDVTVLSKSAGSREDLWGGEIRGKQGYFPKNMVKETKIFQKATFLVDTELGKVENSKVPVPDKVQEPYEIVHGTTIYLNSEADIKPTSTDTPIEATAVPNINNEIKIDDTISSEAIDKKVITSTEDTFVEIQDSKEVENDELQNNINKMVENDSIAFLDVEVTENDNSNIDNNSQETKSEESVENNEELIEESDSESDSSPKKEESSNLEHTETPLTLLNEFVEQIVNQITEGTNVEAESLQNVIAEPVQPSVANEISETVQETSPNVSEPIQIADADILEPLQTDESEPVQPSLANATSESVLEASPNVSEPIQAAYADILEPFQTNVSEAVEAEVVDVEQFDEPITNKMSETIGIEGLEFASDLQDLNNFTDESINDTVEATTFNPEYEIPLPIVEEVETVSSNPIIEDSVTLPIVDTPDSESVENQMVSTEDMEEIKIKKDDSNKDAQESDNKLDEEATETNEDITPAPPSISDAKNADQESISKEENLVDPVEDSIEEQNVGFWSNIMGLFSFGTNQIEDENLADLVSSEVLDDTKDSDRVEEMDESIHSKMSFEPSTFDPSNFNSDIFLYLITTAASVIIFLFGYIVLDKSKREGPLIAKINRLEKDLLVLVKENQILQDRFATESGYETNDKVPVEVAENLKIELVELTQVKSSLEEQIQSLEKELENSTEVGMELNRMLSEVLSSENGSDVLKSNVDNLQKQLVEQQSVITSINATLADTNTENHELRLEVELSNKKVLDLQAELDKMLMNMLKIEEEKESQQATVENELTKIREKYNEVNRQLQQKDGDYTIELKQLQGNLEKVARKLELKTKEFNSLTDTFKQLKIIRSNDASTLQNILEIGNIKAELQVLRNENEKFTIKLQQEEELKQSFEKKARDAVNGLKELTEKYDQVDQIRVESQTKLEVLSNYFKEKELQLQREINNHEKLWAEKKGEATSTTERMTFMQEQLQNYKLQTESLKQEIISQEIELKSQISVLEKKVHENWVSARQAERKVEESKQEAAQLRHRLTLRERAFQEDKTHLRFQSPAEQNGESIDSPASPPLLYSSRDHLTKSPPISGLPPFLPPPPGVPFMPPPMHGVPPFIPPPPPNMFPGDHRPPPLGRMSSPPLNPRYSPSSRGYSPYDQNSSSPSDSEYGTSPPRRRAFSPYNSRQAPIDYKRGRPNDRGLIKGGSSGSGHSNESLEKINRQQSKV